MKKSWQRCMRSMALAGVLGTVLSFGAVPVPHASANVWGAVIGVVQGGVVYSQIDKELKYYNNTEEGRQKFREDLDETHHLFKDFVKRMRPSLDIDKVATGEHWYGVQALEKGLVDVVETSDELLLGLIDNHDLIGVRYQQRKKMLDRFTGSAAESVFIQ